MGNNDQDKMLLGGFVILSLLISFALIFYGVGVVSGNPTYQGTAVFAYVTIAYGMGNVAVLSLAWTTREKWSVSVISLLALCYLGVFVMDALKAGFDNPMQYGGILVMAFLLWTNYFAVKKVVERS